MAVANTGTGNRVMTSPDGITLDPRTSAADNACSVCYGNGLFVAVANTGTNNRHDVPRRHHLDPSHTCRRQCLALRLLRQWTLRGCGQHRHRQPRHDVPRRHHLDPRTSAADNIWRQSTAMDSSWSMRWYCRLRHDVPRRHHLDPLAPLPQTTNWYSVCYGNGLFVAVADYGPAFPRHDVSRRHHLDLVALCRRQRLELRLLRQWSLRGCGHLRHRQPRHDVNRPSGG